MKSLYDILQESLLDDEEVIINDIDNKIYGEVLLKNIIEAKSFKDYEHQIAALKDILDNELKLYCGPDKKPRFKSGGTYIAINMVDVNLIYRNRNGEIPHSRILIGVAGSPIHYEIAATENVYGRHDCIETGVSSYDIKLRYSKQQIAQNSNSYIYRIDNTNFEDMIAYMSHKKPYVINRI